MKNAILLHGWGDAPKSYWFPYLKRELEKLDYEVWCPELPSNDWPILETQLPFVLENGVFTSETLMVGHSAACPLILSVLEKLNAPVSKAILVSGFYMPIEGAANGVIQDYYDFAKIGGNCRDFFFINSNNDPYKCDDGQGRFAFDQLGGTLIIRDGEGHMGSGKYNQPYTEFPLLVKLAENI